MLVLTVVSMACACVALIVASVLAWLWWSAKQRAEIGASENQTLRGYLERYRGIMDIEQAQAVAAQQLAHAQGELTNAHASLQHASAELGERRRVIALLEEQEGLHQLAFYQTRYGLPSASAYEAKLEQIRARQKAMLQAGAAATCSQEWRVDGNAKKGRQMIEQQLKLMLRAFNGECDAAIGRVNYKNVDTMRQRIERAAEAIDKLGKTKHCSLSSQYLSHKLEELFLVHEHAEKLQAEREEQREIRARMAEEMREEKEREKALREAEKEEGRYEKALLEAREELGHASEKQRAKLEAAIAELQQRLLETQRRKSQAQLTRSGHVYVISNIGSFGDGVFKIGMTRRLDPMDRVWELSDASVPFDFDVHAMVYTEDAPALENQLHRHFEAVRMNRVNLRREFFRATLQDIELAARRYAPGAKMEFTLAAEAEEFRKSLTLEREARAIALSTPQRAAVAAP